MILVLLCLVFLFLYTLLIRYYRRGWARTPAQVNGAAGKKFLSVVIAARNEERTIGRLLRALEEQSFPRESFEVLVVDDYSTDATASVVKNFGSTQVRLLQPLVPAALSSKKKAVEAGVHAARSELVVITDADCIPGKDWLQTIHDFYVGSGAVFIAAPVKYSYQKKALQLFQALDFLTLQGITAASVHTGFHSMCNGANLAYSRQAFIDVNGFEGIDAVATGDDMLLMHKIRKKHPHRVYYLKDRAAIVHTAALHRFRDFIGQRKRWASKTFVYEDKRIMWVLVFVYLFNCLFVVLLIAALLHPYFWWLAAGFLVIKTLIEFPFVHSVAHFYDEEKLMRYFFLFQPLHIFYTVVIGPLSQIGRYEWKGRRTK